MPSVPSVFTGAFRASVYSVYSVVTIVDGEITTDHTEPKEKSGHNAFTVSANTLMRIIEKPFPVTVL